MLPSRCQPNTPAALGHHTAPSPSTKTHTAVIPTKTHMTREKAHPRPKWGTYPPPPLVRATLKCQNLVETTPLVALTRVWFVCAVRKHKR